MSLYSDMLKTKKFHVCFDSFSSLDYDEAAMLSYLIYYDDLVGEDNSKIVLSEETIRLKRPNWSGSFIKRTIKSLSLLNLIFLEEVDGQKLYRLNIDSIKKLDSVENLGHIDTIDITEVKEKDTNKIDAKKDTIEKTKKKQTRTRYSREDENLPDADFFEKFKSNKNPRVLISWTRRTVSDKECADVIISWIELMIANNKWQTLQLFNDKLAFLYDNKGSLNVVDIVRDTIEKGYFSFSFSIDYLNRKNSFSQNKKVWTDKVKIREESPDTSKLKLRGN